MSLDHHHSFHKILEEDLEIWLHLSVWGSQLVLEDLVKLILVNTTEGFEVVSVKIDCRALKNQSVALNEKGHGHFGESLRHFFSRVQVTLKMVLVEELE